MNRTWRAGVWDGGNHNERTARVWHWLASGRGQLVDRLMVWRRWAEDPPQGRARAHAGRARRAHEEPSRGAASQDAARRAGPYPDGPCDHGRGRRRALATPRDTWAQEVPSDDRRLGPAQPHYAVLRGDRARQDRAPKHRALHRPQAEDAGTKDRS